jgi:hypothetical protein
MSRRAKNPKVVAGVPFYNPDEQSARGRHVGTLLLIQGCVSLHPRPPAAMVSHCVDVIEIKTLSIYARWRRHEEDPRSAQGSAKCLYFQDVAILHGLRGELCGTYNSARTPVMLLASPDYYADRRSVHARP